MRYSPPSRKKLVTLAFFTLIILLCSQFMIRNVKAQNSTTPYFILFDEAHDQYFTYSNGTFITALDYLNQTADFLVHLNKEPLNDTSQLLSYDLIIIGNPGPEGNFSSNEINALKNYTELGGNLMLLCNYNYVLNPPPDENITGHATYLNNLTQALNLPASFIYYDLNDETHNTVGPRFIVEIESQNFPFLHPIQWKLSKVLTYTSGLNVTSDEGVIASGYPDSYLKNGTSGILPDTPWLYATQKNDSRIILCGSTVMFSDLNVTDTAEVPYEGVSWINAIDNLRLWANLIQWALISETTDFFISFLVISSIIAAFGIGLFIYYSFFSGPKSSTYEIETEKLKEERALILKQARTHASEGNYNAAAQSYKKASRISNKLGDFRSEKLYNRQYREFIAKLRKK